MPLEIASEANFSTLPHDAQVLIMQKLHGRDKALAASICRASANACRNSWGVADYFEMAGSQRQPLLQVPREAAAPGDSAKWLALTKDLQSHGKVADARHYLPGAPPLALMALAQQPVCKHSHRGYEYWPLYEEALRLAYRPQEAAVFARLMSDLDALKDAMDSGDVPTLRRLVDAGIPIRLDDVIPSRLEAHPEIAVVVISTLLNQGDTFAVAEAFLLSGSHVNDVFLRHSQFNASAYYRFILFQELLDCRPEHTDTSVAKMTALIEACTDDQATELACGCRRPESLHGKTDRAADLRDISLTAGGAYKIALLLPFWIAAGGNPTDVLCRLDVDVFGVFATTP